MEIASGVFTYRGRGGDKIRPGAGSSNVTIIRGDSLTIVDSGVMAGGAFSELKAGVSADGLMLSDIEWVLHTHCHWDHINADGELLSKYGVKIASGEVDVPFIEDREKNFNAFIRDFGEFAREVFPYPMMLARFLLWVAFGRQPKLRVDRALSNGDVVDTGRKIEVVSLPGHTAGHMGYFVPDVGVLILGDLIDFENSQGMDINNPHSDYESALRSLGRVIELEPEIIIPGHGEPTVGRKEVRSEMERALRSGYDYPKMIKVALGSGPQRLKELTYRVFPDIPFSMESMTMMLVLIILLYMEREEMVKRTSDRSGKPVWVC